MATSIVYQNAPSVNTPTPFNPIIEPRRSVAVLNLQRGENGVLATLDVKIGGLIVRNVSVRRGRGGTIYINFPRRQDKETGKWLDLVEFNSQSLETSVRAAIEEAVGGVTR